MADIFISYAHEDRARVGPLAAALEAAGHSVWWDRMIDGGSEFAADIEAQLDEAKIVIAIWSDASRASRWVKDEAAAGADEKKLIPISLDGKPAPIGFRQFHAIDFKNWNARADGSEMADLLRVVAMRISGEALPRPAAAAAQRRLSLQNVGAVIGAVLVGALLMILSPANPSLQGAKTREISWAPPGRTILENSIAVLPFNTTDQNDDHRSFALGLHDQVLSQLAKISSIRIISRNSVMPYQKTPKPIRDIALELGVEMILEGTINRIRDRVNVDVKLFQGENELLVWEGSFDRQYSVENILEIQAAITRNIARELGAVLTGKEKTALAAHPTRNTEAYAAYIRGRMVGRYGDATEAGFSEAITAFDEAIALDPLFARAYAEKANAHLSLYWSGADRKKTSQWRAPRLTVQRSLPHRKATRWLRWVFFIIAYFMITTALENY